MTWKDKTCEKCFYRVDMECRRNPPVHIIGMGKYIGGGEQRFPWVRFGRNANVYHDACAEHKEIK